MAFQPGTDFRLLIETATPGTFVEILGLQVFDRDDSQTTTAHNSFGATTPFVTLDTPATSLTASGMFDPADPGQVLAFGHRSAGTAVDIQVLHDGTNGYTQEVRIGGATYGANADGSPQAIAFTFAPTGATPVIEGTGPLP